MFDERRPALEAWASSRGLEFAAEGELPPVTRQLRRGIGIGARRATLIAPGKRIGTVESWLQRRPERASYNLCSGRLPGGLDGTLAHHVHLYDRGQQRQPEQPRWVGYPDTMVLVALPADASRAVCVLGGGPGGEVSAAATLGRRGPDPEYPDPLRDTVPIPTKRHAYDEVRWTAWPAESERTMATIVDQGTRAALAVAPEGTRVELEFGWLLVAVDNRTLDDSGELDALCRLAAAIVGGLERAAREHPPLDPERPLPADPDRPRTRWVSAGVDLRPWPDPPSDVTTAQEAYRTVSVGAARPVARKVRGVVLGAGSVSGLLNAAVFAGVWALSGELSTAIVVGVGMFVLTTGTMARGAGIAARAVAGDLTEARTRPWGLEAFARGYARTRGLRTEDPDELRRRLGSPVPGRAQKAWHGDLGDGVLGHLAIWIDPTPAPAPPRHWLLAVVDAPAGRKPRVDAPYVLLPAPEGLCVVGEPVGEDERSVGRLDRLRAVARGVAGRPAASADRAVERVPPS